MKTPDRGTATGLGGRGKWLFPCNSEHNQREMQIKCEYVSYANTKLIRLEIKIELFSRYLFKSIGVYFVSISEAGVKCRSAYCEAGFSLWSPGLQNNHPTKVVEQTPNYNSTCSLGHVKINTFPSQKAGSHWRLNSISALIFYLKSEQIFYLNVE